MNRDTAAQPVCLVFIRPDRFGEWRFHEARRYTVDLNIIFGPFDRHDFRELGDCTLGHAVYRDSIETKENVDRTDMHDFPAAKFPHNRVRGLAQKVNTPQVDRGDHVEIFPRDILDPLSAIGCGIVDQDVQPPLVATLVIRGKLGYPPLVVMQAAKYR